MSESSELRFENSHNARTTWSSMSLRYWSLVTVRIANSFIIISSKKYIPKRKFEVTSHHIVPECSSCLCMAWESVKPHVRQLCVFSTPSKQKCASSVQEVQNDFEVSVDAKMHLVKLELQNFAKNHAHSFPKNVQRFCFWAAIYSSILRRDGYFSCCKLNFLHNCGLSCTSFSSQRNTQRANFFKLTNHVFNVIYGHGFEFFIHW